MYIISHSWFLDMEPSPAMHAIREVLSTKYGPDQVIFDSADINLDTFRSSEQKFIVVCNTQMMRLHKLHQIDKDEIMARLPEGMSYRESVATYLVSWLRQHNFINQVHCFTWDQSSDLELALDKLASAPLPVKFQGKHDEIRRTLKTLFEDSYQNRDSHSQLSNSKLDFVSSRMNATIHVIVADGLPREVIPGVFSSRPYTLVGDVLDDPTALAERLARI